jgi:hypothetical protein
MNTRLALSALALISLVASVPACTVARWSPLATSPEVLDARHSRTVRGYDLNGERVILQGATLSGDTLRGVTCVRLANGPVDCVPRAIPVSELRILEVRQVDAPPSVAAILAGVAIAPLVVVVVFACIATGGGW